ncbi:MAG: VOC family protein [Actinomycetota bacterium]
MIRLVALEVGGDTEPWETIGLPVDEPTIGIPIPPRRSRIADVEVRFAGGEPGLQGWVFAHPAHEGDPLVVDVAGIRTTIVGADPEHASNGNTTSPLAGAAAVGLDHVVVRTSDPEGFRDAVGRVLGLELRRVRPVGNGWEQWFYKPDNTVIEVVTSPDLPRGPATLWGMVASVDDLDAIATRLGDDVVSAPKAAVQPGRSISTVRQSVGLGVAFALMTPHQR